ncbi:hypothetical protein [Clostridium sp.]|uniref:hypothetical protein n=1 Tax=Clostridium sp. TaxID=1506 RepID=UPI00262DF52F|nr:hypothetical protein [Clostridium sp.]
MKKMILSDEDFDYLAKGLAFGSGIGILLGIFIYNFILSFSGCSIIGIIIALIYSRYKSIKK